MLLFGMPSKPPSSASRVTYPNTEAIAALPTSAEEGVGAPNILVVNDDRPSLLALCGLLRERPAVRSYNIVAAQSGQEALRAVLRQDFAVIFLDVNMPLMDGYETAQAIRSRPRCAMTPIIFVTAYLADEFDRARAYACGAADFLFAPVIPQVLQAKADVFVKLYAHNAALLRQAEKLAQREAELSAANEQLQAEMAERLSAERQSAARDDFLAMLGHELRNPLSAISSAASLAALRSTDSATQAKAREIIERQSRHMISMVEDVLDLSRALTGKLVVRPAPVDLATVLADSLTKVQARGSGHTWTSALTHGTIMGDALRVAQMLDELIGNAVKYTPAGGHIHVELTHVAQFAEVRVRDDGEGLAPEHLPYVFDLFVQAGVTIDRQRGGLGMGLAMVQRLCELHGGQVSATSAGVGLGSTFTLRLPLAPPTAFGDDCAEPTPAT